MSFRSIVRDVRDSFGSLSRRSFEVRLSSLTGLTGHHRGKSSGCNNSTGPHLCPQVIVVDPENRWAGLPPELLRDVIKRLEESEGAWPNRKHVVACAAVCRSWREMCKEIVQRPEFCGKLTFPVSLKLPGPRDGTIQCFIKRDKSKLTYHLYLCLSSAVLVENGKFLLSAKRTRRTTYTEYIVSMDPDNISRSSNTYIGKMRSNFLGTKFIIYDTEPPYNASSSSSSASTGPTSRRFHPKKVSPRVAPAGRSSYRIAQVSYELNVLGTRGPRRMHCIMHSIPASALAPGGSVPAQPDHISSCPFLDESFRSTTTSVMDRSLDFSSSRFSDISGGAHDDDVGEGIGGGTHKEEPLILRNKAPRWHEQLQCWCLNFRGRVTVASVKNFQLIAAGPSGLAQVGPAGSAAAVNTPAGPAVTNANPNANSAPGLGSSDHDKIILQFGKVAKDMFTMDYRYPLSAFQAFAICLTSFDTKLACE